MASAVIMIRDEWWGYVWDADAAVQHSDRAATVPATAMAFAKHENREQAEAWCRRHERDVITRYRALNAYNARIGTVRPEWLSYYRLWNADAAVMDSGETDPEKAVDLWMDAYERGG